jgi:hypothetical protein
MKHQFLLHKLAETFLAVNITGVGVSSLPSIQFTLWAEAENYFLGLGAKQKAVDACYQDLLKTRHAILTIE